MGFPATFNRTLGLVKVWGLSRDPTPATGIIAFNDYPPEDKENYGSRKPKNLAKIPEDIKSDLGSF
jgi:hypothetical protein